MEERFMASMINCYFIALGVIIGGAVIGGIGSFLVGNQPPLTMIFRLSNSLKIWAIVAAIGGTFDAISNFERGIFDGATVDIIKQILLIIAAMGGVQTGSLLIRWLTQEHIT